jgi:DNA polymerase V
MMNVIPIYIEAGISGFESPAAEYKELGLSLDSILIQNPNASFVGVASGQSMQEAGIFDGDILIVDRSLIASQNDVIVANYNGCFTCKFLDKNLAQLTSASPLYKPIQISADDQFQIEGVVTRSIRLHRPAPELLSCMP